MEKLVHNERLHYNVDITARLWRSALQGWWERMTHGEKVDLIIGIDGKPLIIPKDTALYYGEWVVNTDRVLIGIDIILNDYLERYIRNVVVRGDGIVDVRRSRENRDRWYMEYIDVNHRRVIIIVLTPRTDGSKYHTCERAVARLKYDVVHNAQYIADNFGLPADGQTEGFVIL